MYIFLVTMSNLLKRLAVIEAKKKDKFYFNQKSLNNRLIRDHFDTPGVDVCNARRHAHFSFAMDSWR